MATAESIGNTTLAPPVSLLSDEKAKLRVGQSECSHNIRTLALDASTMAQDVVHWGVHPPKNCLTMVAIHRP
jgi:hypothetical protein